MCSCHPIAGDRAECSPEDPSSQFRFSPRRLAGHLGIAFKADVPNSVGHVAIAEFACPLLGSEERCSFASLLHSLRRCSVPYKGIARTGTDCQMVAQMIPPEDISDTRIVQATFGFIFMSKPGGEFDVDVY